MGPFNKVRPDFVTRPTQNRGFAPLRPCRIGSCESGRAMRCFVLRSALGSQDEQTAQAALPLLRLTVKRESTPPVTSIFVLAALPLKSVHVPDLASRREGGNMEKKTALATQI